MVLDLWGQTCGARAAPDHMIERCCGAIVTATSVTTVFLASDSTGSIPGHLRGVHDGLNML